MKKFICTILICLMLPIATIIFTACQDDKYAMSSFYTRYKNIASAAEYLRLEDADNTYELNLDSKKINIDYSKSSKLSSLVEDETTAYYGLKYFYQQLLDDTLSPLYIFGQKISTSSKVSSNQSKQLYKTLSSLEQNYHDINYYLGTLINSLNSSSDENVNLSYLKKVFLQYEKTITTAGDLASIVCNVYFDTILSNSNFNYASIPYTELTESDLTRISVETRARMYYYKSVYANIYNEVFVRNGEIADQIIASLSSATIAYTPYAYVSKISSLNDKPTQTLINNKQAIHNYAVSLYHIQNNFETAYSHFNIATSKVAYLDLNEKSTNNELNYGKIIDNFTYGMAVDSYEILSNLISLLYL